MSEEFCMPSKKFAIVGEHFNPPAKFLLDVLLENAPLILRLRRGLRWHPKTQIHPEPDVVEVWLDPVSIPQHLLSEVGGANEQSDAIYVIHRLRAEGGLMQLGVVSSGQRRSLEMLGLCTGGELLEIFPPEIWMMARPRLGPKLSGISTMTLGMGGAV